jgi:hypothetical protein
MSRRWNSNAIWGGGRYRTAWLLKHKLMQVMCEREEPRQLDGRVEIDDAYLGGELPGGKSGRGSQNKVSFIAAVQTTETGQPLKVCLKKLEFTKEAIAEWAKTALASSARVVSDGLWCFQAVTASGATHERTVTGGGPSCVKLEQFRAVNTFLGNLKTAYSVAVAPALPTIAESGFPGFESSSWVGLLAPASTPQAVIDRLYRSVAAALKSNDVVDTLATIGAEARGLSPAEFAAYYQAEMRTWADVIRRGGVRLN